MSSASQTRKKASENWEQKLHETGLFEIFSNNSKEEGGGGWGQDGSEAVCAVGLEAVMARDRAVGGVVSHLGDFV